MDEENQEGEEMASKNPDFDLFFPLCIALNIPTNSNRCSLNGSRNKKKLEKEPDKTSFFNNLFFYPVFFRTVKKRYKKQLNTL
ncbi:hypothetical protein [Lederbergia ruris]|uniref:hypothetical protein n=1 Tax=Lederbergia ruris TaxID=217495 RepID=UPI0039A2D684